MKTIAKLSILILVCFLFLGFGCKKQDTTDQTTDQTQTQDLGILGLDNQTVLSTTLQNLQTSKNKMVYWDRNGQFISLSVDFLGDLEIGNLNSIYSFQSTLDNTYSKYYYFTVSFNNIGQSIQTLVYKDDYLKDLPAKPLAINTTYLKQSWLDAFKLAEDAGGKTFREKDPQNTKINLSLHRSSPDDYLYWFVKYTYVNADDVLTAQIDANTGKLIDSSGTQEETGADQTQVDQTNQTNNSTGQ